MNQIIKQEIRKMYKSFDKADNFYEKEYIMTFFNYLKEVFPNDLEIRTMNKTINDKLSLLKYESILYFLIRKKEIDDYVMNNKDFIFENIIPPDYYEKIDDRSIVPLRDENISYILESFFSSMGDDIYLFFKKISDEGRLMFGISNEISFTSLDNSNIVIFVKELNDLLDIMVLIHEIGHAYYYYLNNTKLYERDDFETELKEEIPAKIMEIKFVKFLFDNGLYEQSEVLKNLFDYAYYEYGKNTTKFKNIKYIIASDMANTFGEDVIINDFFKHIHDASIHNLIIENTIAKGKGRRLSKS